MTDPTPFIESNILLAIQVEDYERARYLIEQLSPNERDELTVVTDEMKGMLRNRATRTGPMPVVRSKSERR